MNDKLSIRVAKPEGYQVSARTAAALEELAAACLEDVANDEEIEVQGFGQMDLTGGLRTGLQGPEVLSLCLGYLRAGGGTTEAGPVATTRGGELCLGLYW